MKRGEVASVLYKEKGKLTNTSTTNPFSDISSSKYINEIITFASNGYLNGKGEVSFMEECFYISISKGLYNETGYCIKFT